MLELSFQIHGVPFALFGDTQAVERLAVHFAAFAEPTAAASSRLRVELRRRAPELASIGRLRADQVLERGLVYNVGPQTWVDHHGAALSFYDFAAEQGYVEAKDTARLVEHGYLMVQARLGPRLEERGLVRVHGLGFVRDGRATLVLTPSGGGKSRLALALLAEPTIELLSDDVVLIDGAGLARAFPMPIGVSLPVLAEPFGKVLTFDRTHHGRKYVLELDGILDRFARGAHPVERVVLATRVSQPPSRLLPAPRGAVAKALWRDAVVGLGLPQVIELIARRGATDLWRQAPAVWRRSRAATALLRRARGELLEVGEPAEAIRRLLGR